MKQIETKVVSKINTKRKGTREVGRHINKSPKNYDSSKNTYCNHYNMTSLSNKRENIWSV
jgi:hypothetical protein